MLGQRTGLIYSTNGITNNYIEKQQINSNISVPETDRSYDLGQVKIKLEEKKE